ncbi:MAG: MmcQ/YjbR family DNA-binding protein [Nakamurella sp.]
MGTIDDVRELASVLPRSAEAIVRDRVKFRIGRIVYLAFSRDESIMGFAFPKEERAAMLAAEPDRYVLPSAGDLRYNWLELRMELFERDELREIVLDAWQLVVPKTVAAAYFHGR